MFEEKRFGYQARDKDGVEVKSMIDLVLVKKDMLHYVQDVGEQMTWFCMVSQRRG